MPSVRLAGSKRSTATRCTSASVTARTRSRSQEQQAPVALRHRFGQRHADALGIGVLLLPAIQPLGACAFDFGRGQGFAGHRLDHRQQRRARGLGVLPRRQLGTQCDEARIVQRLGERKGAGGQLGFGQPLVQPSGGRVAHHQRQQLHRGVLGVRARDGMVGGHQLRRTADAAQRDHAFAVLRRVDGVQRRQRASRLGDPAEVPFNQAPSPRAGSKVPETISVALSGW